MAKTGVTYYNVDTDRYQDKRIKKLRKDFGPTGVAIYDYILCDIYRDKGCFIEWDESTAFDVADYFGLKETLVDEIVNYCCSVGLFNKALLSSERVLTSLSIQNRYMEMCIRMKRKDSFIPDKIKILTEKVIEIPEEYGKIQEELNKVKKSKVKKKKESKVFIAPTLDEVKNYFLEKGFSAAAAERAFTGYSEAEWHDSRGKPVLNWKQKMNNVWFTPENRIENGTNQQSAIKTQNGDSAERRGTSTDRIEALKKW